jgi:predicted CoA-substrate-specific enzyme activase
MTKNTPTQQYIGLDLGSRFIKIATDGGETHKIDTIEFYKKHIKRDGEQVSIDLANIYNTEQENSAEPVSTQFLATGYGRNLLQFDNIEIISEIKAHFYGAKMQTGEQNFTLVDIGGQDCKVIDVKDGYINDFAMNDKCAASTGRFVEQSARILDMPMAEFEAATDSPITLSDTCAVFCESELIGKLARGATDRQLAAGVNLSIAKRLAPAIKRYKPTKLFMAGGASSPALVHFITELTGVAATVLPQQQFNGALGCIFYMKHIY